MKQGDPYLSGVLGHLSCRQKKLKKRSISALYCYSCCSCTQPRLTWAHGLCSPPGSSVHRILQARILEWVAMPSSRGSSQPRGQTWVPYIAGRFFTIWATGEAQDMHGQWPYHYYRCSRIQPIFNLRAALKSSQETTSLICIKRFSGVLNGVSLAQEDVIAFPPTVRSLLEVWEAKDSKNLTICIGTFLLQSSSEVSNFNTPENCFLRLFIQNHAYSTLMSHLRDFRNNPLYQLTLLITSDSNLYVKLSYAL